MWERFSYYGMRGFLILYAVAPLANGGLGFDDALASSPPDPPRHHEISFGGR